MSKVTGKTLEGAYKPFDIVTNKEGAVGFIQEVSVNDCQEEPQHQISYSVEWLVGDDYTAWWKHHDLTLHCNLFIKIAECACHPSGSNAYAVQNLFNHMKRPINEEG